MRQLIIGIDGGDETICSRLPMPFVNQKLESECNIKLTEDLLSRGWVEILCGKYARDTGAFYMVPQVNGTNEIRFKFSLKQLLENKDVQPIWDVVPPGMKVGMMNVPTTFPAQEVDGFFVSGAGGGVNKVVGIPEELCYPKSLSDELSELGYKIDIRFGTAGIKEIHELFEKLDDMIVKRADAFVQLVDRYQPDLGFVTFRATTVVQYLAMSEMLAYFDRTSNQSAELHKATDTWAMGFESLYKTLDDSIKRVFETCSPENWVITSDHGAVGYKYRLNIHRFLQDHGYQPYSVGLLKNLKSLVANVIRRHPFAISRQPEIVKSKAFGHWYLSGIFVNDQRRFGGPVAESQTKEITESICLDFNNTDEAKKYGMEARPYRSLFPDAKYNDSLPDVKIHCSDEIFFSRFPGEFFRPNPDYQPLRSISHVRGGMHSGQKGRHPLFCCNNGLKDIIREDDPRDLTLVYKVTKRLFS